ncbi:HAAS signaling domain-containing protein [Janibacter sp. GS2]|uniref:HAAS signaling domain-containing protein n=1 Tax=Janibacter sp. GS2 TaxID=3442646 RepID=UPI003EB84499
MNTDPDSDRAVSEYRQSLIAILRLKEVPGERIGQIVAEVESHVAETGEDPVEAFGPPRAYAAQLSDEQRPSPWWHTAVTALAAGVAGWLIAQGALGLLLGEHQLGQSGLLWLAIGVLIAIPVAINVHRGSTPVRDPRTGVDMVPMPRWVWAALAGLPIGMILITWGLIEIFG